MRASSRNVNTVTVAASSPATRYATRRMDAVFCDLRRAVNDRRDRPRLFIDVATFGASADDCAVTHAPGGVDRRPPRGTPRSVTVMNQTRPVATSCLERLGWHSSIDRARLLPGIACEQAAGLESGDG